MPKRIKREISTGFALAAVFIALLGGGAWWGAVRAEETLRWVDHTHEVLYQLQDCLADALNMQTATRGFLLTGRESFLEPYQRGVARIEKNLERVDLLTADNPDQYQLSGRLREAATRLTSIMRGRIELRRQREFSPALDTAALEAGNAAIADVRAVISAMEAAERKLLADRSAAAQTELRRAMFVLSVGALLATGCVAAARFVVLRHLQRRTEAEDERDRFFKLSIDLLCVSSAKEGRFVTVSPGVTDILGWTPAEFLARPYMDQVHPDDRSATQAEVERQVARGERVLEFENRYQHKDGSWRTLSWRSVPQPGGLMFAIARDVTQRKQVESQIRQLNARLSDQNRQHRAIFESLPGLCLVLNPELVIVTATDAYLRATMTTREKLIGLTMFQAFPDNPADPTADGSRNLRASLDRVLQHRRADTMAIQKYDVRRPDGTFEERFWSPVNSPVFGADGQLEYIIHRAEDVTEFIRKKSGGGAPAAWREQLEKMEAEVYQSSQQVQLANQQLHAANAELEAFSYSVSHDLRAPLRHIDGFTNLLQKNSAATLDPQGRRYLETISNSARQMGRLIDDLLAFSRVGRTQMQPVEIDQDALVATVVREGRFPTGVEWRIAALPRAHGDHAMLKQVWANLIDNAVKYSSKVAAPCVEIGGGRDTATGELVYYVRDNGAGFDMRYAAKLYGVFQRLHGVTEFEGTGIGLANVRRIVTRHGGRTWAEGEPGRGATFHFSLPVNPALTPT